MDAPSDEYPRIYRNAHVVGGLAAYAARLKGELRRADVELKEPKAQSQGILRRREYYATLLAHVEAVGVSLDPDAHWGEIAPVVTAPPYRTDRGELVIAILRFLKARSQPATVNEVQQHVIRARHLELTNKTSVGAPPRGCLGGASRHAPRLPRGHPLHEQAQVRQVWPGKTLVHLTTSRRMTEGLPLAAAEATSSITTASTTMTHKKLILAGTHKPPPGARRSAARVMVESEKQFLAQVRRGVHARRTGKRKKPVTTVSFESVLALLNVLTPRRCALIEAVKAMGGFDSIEQLALAVARDRAAVRRDIQALSAAGLL